MATPAGSTATLAAFIVDTPTDAIPAGMLHEAKRTLLNVFGVALSAAQDPSVTALEAATDSGNPAATVIGRARAGAGQAALVNGYLAHL